jgi:hypothetical protein
VKISSSSHIYAVWQLHDRTPSPWSCKSYSSWLSDGSLPQTHLQFGSPVGRFSVALWRSPLEFWYDPDNPEPGNAPTKHVMLYMWNQEDIGIITVPLFNSTLLQEDLTSFFATGQKKIQCTCNASVQRYNTATFRWMTISHDTLFNNLNASVAVFKATFVVVFSSNWFHDTLQKYWNWKFIKSTRLGVSSFCISFHIRKTV